jgi:hypothetical protein
VFISSRLKIHIFYPVSRDHVWSVQVCIKVAWDILMRSQRIQTNNFPKPPLEGTGLPKHRPCVIYSLKICRESAPGYCISTIYSSISPCLHCCGKISGWAPWAQRARMRGGSPSRSLRKRRKRICGCTPGESFGVADAP